MCFGFRADETYSVARPPSARKRRRSTKQLPAHAAAAGASGAAAPPLQVPAAGLPGMSGGQAWDSGLWFKGRDVYCNG